MKNDLAAPSAAPTDQADGDNSEAPEVEAEASKPSEPEGPVFVKEEGEFARFLREFGIHGRGLSIAKFFFVMFGLLIVVSGLVLFGVLINTFLII